MSLGIFVISASPICGADHHVAVGEWNSKWKIRCAAKDLNEFTYSLIAGALQLNLHKSSFGFLMIYAICTYFKTIESINRYQGRKMELQIWAIMRRVLRPRHPSKTPKIRAASPGDMATKGRSGNIEVRNWHNKPPTRTIAVKAVKEQATQMKIVNFITHKGI